MGDLRLSAVVPVILST